MSPPHQSAAFEALECETDQGYIPRLLRESVDVPRSKRERWHKEARELMHPAKNGYNDPLSHLLLIDTLLRLRHGQQIRAAALKDLLNKDRPQLLWDSVTVGRILTELTDMAAHRGATDQHLTSARDRFGTFFIISDTPAAYVWLVAKRDYLSDKVREIKTMEKRGLDMDDRSLSVWEALPA